MGKRNVGWYESLLGRASYIPHDSTFGAGTARRCACRTRIIRCRR